LSAPYPGDKEDEPNALFHEWQLDRPSDILQVYFLIKNIDNWTVGKFRERVVRGIDDLLDAVVKKNHKYEPWKRAGDLTPSSKKNKENINISITTETSVSTPEPSRKGKGKGKGRRRS
jgi:solute carrier family 25 carnitine/acylcarnitine transporter 20/29